MSPEAWEVTQVMHTHLTIFQSVKEEASSQFKSKFHSGKSIQGGHGARPDKGVVWEGSQGTDKEL